jgi:AGZA family xanthine/uracil permease-like MFS transporter
VLSWIGLLHSEEVRWAASPQVALGYLLLGAVLVAIGALRRREPVPAAPVDDEPALAE